MIVRIADLLARVPKMLQKIKGWVVQLFYRNSKCIAAEIFAQCPLVEHELDIESGRHSGLNFIDLNRTEPMPKQGGVVNTRRVTNRAMPNRIGCDLFNLAA